MAVERERPLETDQSRLKTLLIATKAMVRAVVGATTLPMIVLAPFGIAGQPFVRRRSKGMAPGQYDAGVECPGDDSTSRDLRLLHASTRHDGRLDLDHSRCRWAGPGRSDRSVQSSGDSCGDRGSVRSCRGRHQDRARGGLHRGLGTIDDRSARSGVHRLPASRGMVGLTGRSWTRASSTSRAFSLYYASKTGYTFANLDEGRQDPKVRWIVTHDAHLNGPWDYSKILRSLVQNRPPIRTFPEKASRGIARVYVFDLSQPENATADRLDSKSSVLR